MHITSCGMSVLCWPFPIYRQQPHSTSYQTPFSLTCSLRGWKESLVWDQKAQTCCGGLANVGSASLAPGCSLFTYQQTKAYIISNAHTSHTKHMHFPNQDLTVFIMDAVLVENGDCRDCCSTIKKRKNKDVLVNNYPLINIVYLVNTD